MCHHHQQALLPQKRNECTSIMLQILDDLMSQVKKAPSVLLQQGPTYVWIRFLITNEENMCAIYVFINSIDH